MGLEQRFITDLFPVQCGVRWGEPLSALIFILALEVLACQVRENEKVTGIVVNNEEIKLNLFADDMTRFLSYTTAYHRLMETLQLFQQ